VFSYWGWLVWQIIKSNIDVARVILSPSLPISPNVVRVKASQRTTLGLVTYANSITLTPGTVSMYLDGDIIEVHALTESGARELKDGEMDRRVSAIEGSP
jgi:multicomponent Na+:H+ antiporter subunit E